MTKILSQLLEAREPDFRIGVQKLERASGGQSHDIKLSRELADLTSRKLRDLGLDPSDTTAPELYHALNQKLAQTEDELAKLLKLDGLDDSSLAELASQARKLASGRDCFALKASVAKKLFKSHPPKKAMKALGYRSLDSFLRHESLAGIYASAEIFESAGWHKGLLSSYRALMPSDFEIRPLMVTALTSPRWEKLADNFEVELRQNITHASAAGVLAFLPIKEYSPGKLTAMFLQSIEVINDMLATSSYLRLHQVKSDFGKTIANTSKDQPSLNSPVWGSQLDWRTVYEYIAESGGDSLESQLADAEIKTRYPGDVLASLSPNLAFWQNTDHLAYQDGGESVSINPLDVAINYSNNLTFEDRVKHNFKQSLWQKFWQSYLQAEVLGEKLISGIRQELQGPELATEPIQDAPQSLD